MRIMMLLKMMMTIMVVMMMLMMVVMIGIKVMIGSNDCVDSYNDHDADYEGAIGREECLRPEKCEVS